MKRFFSLCLAVCMLMTAFGATAEAAFTAGTYTVTVDGRNGPMTVETVLTDSAIASVTVTDHAETPVICDPAVNDLPKMIVEQQSIGMDAISGCTVTCDAVLNAVALCLTQADANPEDYRIASAPEEKGEDVELTADVIIVGGGGAGLSAAVAARQAGASVIIVEKLASLGGNSLISGSIVNAANPQEQEQVEISSAALGELKSYLELNEADYGEEFGALLATVKGQIQAYLDSGATYMFDSPEFHAFQTYYGGRREMLDGSIVEGKYDVVMQFAQSALDTVNWTKSLGIEYNGILYGYGAMWTRSNNVIGGGSSIINTIKNNALELGAQVYTNICADELVTDETGAVVSVVAYDVKNGTKYTFHADKSVVLTTGGYSDNPEMIVQYNKYWPDLTTEIKSTNVGSLTGDGIIMGQKIGAATEGLEVVQLLATCAALDGTSGIGSKSKMWVNANAVRFVNEGAPRDVASAAVLAQPNGVFYAFGDKEIVEEIGLENVQNQVKKGYAFYAETIEELCEMSGLDADTLKATIETYNGYIVAQNDLDFGRYDFPNAIGEGPYYLSYSAPAVHHTMGGLSIDADTHVLNTEGNIIPNLYAAGEVVGSLHGGNRLGGNAISDYLIYGRIAGDNAANEK